MQGLLVNSVGVVSEICAESNNLQSCLKCSVVSKVEHALNYL